METLIIIALLALAIGSWDWWIQKKREKADFAQYQVNRLRFESEVANGLVRNKSEVNSDD